MSLDDSQIHTTTDLSATLMSEGKRRRGILFLALACAAVGMAVSLQVALNENFVVEEIHLSGYEKGLLEAIRESCGITALGLLALLAGLAEPLIGVAMLLLVGVGLAGYAGVRDFTWLWILSVVWSQGLHIWMPLPNSMMLSLAEPGRTGRRLGQLQAAGAAGSLGILVLILSLNWAGLSIRPMYLIGGTAAVLGAVACLGIPRDIKTPGPRFVMRRRYSLYYLLSFLEGWRKQIFLAFAGFLLVKVYSVPLKAMLTMWTIGLAITWLAAPLAGRLVDRLGERITLYFYYVAIIAVFVAYALVRDARVLCGLYMADNILFTLGLALTTYVRRIAPPEEHTPTLSMGVAMNHVAAVAMPLAGGLLWQRMGYQWTFGLGVVAALMSFLAVSRLPARQAPGPVA